MDCVYMCIWQEEFSELVADYMGVVLFFNCFPVQAGHSDSGSCGEGDGGEMD